MYLSALRKVSLLSFFAALILFTSCKDDKSKSTEDTNATLKEKNVETPKSTNAASGDVALNPAHGQPGHRCDIPVGQPLNSSGEKSSTIKTTQQSPVIKSSGSVPVNSNSSNTTANANPAHGQPGHRCDIPVGAPLN